MDLCEELGICRIGSEPGELPSPGLSRYITYLRNNGLNSARFELELWRKLTYPVACAVMIFLGFNVTFFSQFMLGSQGMPRRYHAYDKVSADLLPTFEMWHRTSSIGSFILGSALFIVLFYLLHSLFRGKPAAKNPWGGKTLEWQTESPPITHNFATDPVCEHGPYDFDVIEGADDHHGQAADKRG